MTSVHFMSPQRLCVERLGARAAALFCFALTLLSGAAPAWAIDEPEAEPPRAHLEGAIGLVTPYAPTYPGAGDLGWHVTPAGFVRWGRFTITGAGGFTTVRNEEVERGVGAELLRNDRLQVRLGLRLDNGRSQSASPTLAGLGDVRSTVRARLAGRYRLDEAWSVSAGLSSDALGRGQGATLDLSVGRDWRLPQGLRLSVSTGVQAADARCMAQWHGVTAAQSVSSGLPEHLAGAGWRQWNVGAQLRRELSPQWSGFVGARASRLLGSAADSPLSLQSSSWNVQAGLVWRFQGAN
jgi:outer membrane protein